jgi:hypothetical protein
LRGATLRAGLIAALDGNFRPFTTSRLSLE